MLTRALFTLSLILELFLTVSCLIVSTNTIKSRVLKNAAFHQLHENWHIRIQPYHRTRPRLRQDYLVHAKWPLKEYLRRE